MEEGVDDALRKREALLSIKRQDKTRWCSRKKELGGVLLFACVWGGGEGID